MSRHHGSTWIWAAAGTVLLASYSSAQVQEDWVARYPGPLHNCYVSESKAIAVDGDGNVYVVGQGVVFDIRFNIVTVKYGPDGTQLWAQYYQGPLNWDFGTHVALDADANVYVTGVSQGVGTGSDIVTLKYTPDGDLQWAQRFDGDDHGNDEATAIAVDRSGVYVTGFSDDRATDADVLLLKYAIDGTPLFTQRYHGPLFGFEIAWGMGLDRSGNVYLGAQTLADSRGTLTFLTLKYDSDGNLQWAQRLEGVMHSYPNAIAVDSDGNSSVTGISHSSPTLPGDYLTVRYDPDGTLLWQQRYSGPTGFSVPTAVAVDANGNTFVTGTTRITDTNNDFVTFKYTVDGDIAWSAEHGGPGHGYDRPVAIAVDASGASYVTGGSRGDDSYDFSTVKYDSDGNLIWEARYQSGTGPGGFCGPPFNQVHALAIDGSAHAYVTGLSQNATSDGWDWATVRYSSTE